MWDLMAEYFPARLVKTADLDPKRNYILAMHPHGIISFSAFLNFATTATGFSRMFPGGLQCWLQGCRVVRLSSLSTERHVGRIAGGRCAADVASAFRRLRRLEVYP